MLVGTCALRVAATTGAKAPPPSPQPSLRPLPVVPAPAQAARSGTSVIPLGLLAAFIATLLVATGLTGRRRL